MTMSLCCAIVTTHCAIVIVCTSLFLILTLVIQPYYSITLRLSLVDIDLNQLLGPTPVAYLLRHHDGLLSHLPGTPRKRAVV